MGKGKGAPEVWVAVVKPGRMLFEMEGVEPRGRARGAARSRPHKLSIADAGPRAHAQRSGACRLSELRELSDRRARDAASAS